MTEATEAPAEVEGEGPTGSLAAPGGDKEDVAAAQGEASEATAAARPARPPRPLGQRGKPSEAFK